jgi:hypothetical protein
VKTLISVILQVSISLNIRTLPIRFFNESSTHVARNVFPVQRQLHKPWISNKCQTVFRSAHDCQRRFTTSSVSFTAITIDCSSNVDSRDNYRIDSRIFQ